MNNEIEAQFLDISFVDTTYQYYYGIETDLVNLHTPKILFEMEPPEWVQKGKIK